jgi:hypothetical protein
LEVAAVVSSVLLAFFLTRHLTMEVEQSRRLSNEQLSQRLSELQAEHNLLQNRLALAQRGEQMTQRANDELRSMLNELQTQYAELQAELGFFRELASASAEQRSLSVYQVAKLDTRRGASLQLRVALTQGLESRQPAVGKLYLSLIGMQDEVQRTISLDDLSRGQIPEGRAVRFRYFQQEIFDLWMPQGFQPQQLIVRMLADEGDGELLRRVYDWQEIETR